MLTNFFSLCCKLEFRCWLKQMTQLGVFRNCPPLPPTPSKVLDEERITVPTLHLILVATPFTVLKWLFLCVLYCSSAFDYYHMYNKYITQTYNRQTQRVLKKRPYSNRIPM